MPRRLSNSADQAEHSLGEPPFPPVFIDREGTWSHRGRTIDHALILQELKRHLERDEAGLYWIALGRARVPVDVEVTPFVIVSLEAGRWPVLVLDDGTAIDLSGGVTFAIDGRHRLFCRVKRGRDWAIVSRGAHQQLQPYVVEQEGRYWVELGGRRHPIEPGGPEPIERHADT